MRTEPGPGGVDACLAHLPALRRYARLLTGDAQRADDLVQDTLERACAKWSLWQPGTALRGWLMTLMHNVHLNHRRDWRHDESAVALDDAPEPQHEPMLRAGERLDLQRALLQLSPMLREVLLLVSVEEYTYAETAALLAIPIGTVMSRLHRAREQLRRLVGAETATAGSVPPPVLTVVKR